MGRPRKEETVTFSKREIRLAGMRNGRINTKYLTELVLDYKFKRKLDKNYSMPTELAEVILIIIDKMIGSSAWRSYSEDWKEEFRGRATEHVVKYAHNFNLVKCKNGKGSDPYNYFAMIIKNAFIQSLRKCKLYSESMVLMNNDLVYNENQWSESQDFNPNLRSVAPEVDTLDWGTIQ
jgi:hypothetical protein